MALLRSAARLTPRTTSLLRPSSVARVPVRTFAEGDIPATLNLSFSTPEQQLYKNFQAKMVTMKGSSGVFGVLPGHVPTIAQLQPGVVTVEYDGETGTTSEDYFVCGGFAYIKANSDCDVCAVEACKVEDIDLDEVNSLLAEASSASGEDEAAKAEAEIRVEVLTAMAAAAGQA